MAHPETDLAVPGRAALVATSLFLLLSGQLPVGDALWNQTGGDPGHTSVAQMASGPWDIVSVFDGLAPDHWMIRINGPGFVDTPYGITGAARHRETDACSIFRITDLRNGTTLQVPALGPNGEPTFACWVAGYSVAQDILLVCRAQAMRDSGLIAYDGKTLDFKWQVLASDVFAIQGQAAHSPSQAPANDNDLATGCLLGAIDDAAGEVVAPWPASRAGLDYPVHRIAAIALASGQLLWSTVVPMASIAGQNVLSSFPWSEGAGPNWVPLAVTLTSSGVVVGGIALCPDVLQCDRCPPVDELQDAVCEDPASRDDFLPIRQVNAWLTRDGVPVGMMWSEADPNGFQPASPDAGGLYDGYSGGSVWAVANGVRAYFVMGDELVSVDPTAPDPVLRVPMTANEGMQPGYLGFTGPVPFGGGVYTFLTRTISRFDLTANRFDTSAAWTGVGYDKGANVNTLVTTGGEVLWDLTDLSSCDPSAPYQSMQVASCDFQLVVLDHGLRELQDFRHQGSIIPLFTEPVLMVRAPDGRDVPLVTSPVSPWMVVRPSGILYGDPLGRMVYLERVDPRDAPTVTVSGLFPSVDEVLRLRLPRQQSPDAVALRINWGAGEPGAPALDWAGGEPEITLEHRYASAGPRRILLTLVEADGTTRTRTLQVTVGGTPLAGPPGDMPAPSTKGPYVGVGVPAIVELTRPSGLPVEVFADWGDGTLERSAWQDHATLTLEHVYRTEGPRSAAFTTVFLDGRTATRVVPFDIGGTPPPPPSLLERAFAPEYLEYTLFVLGILITLFGAAFGFFVRRRHRTNVGQFLAELEQVRRERWRDPQAALRMLLLLRRRFDDELGRGRLTEDQYKILHDQAGDLLALLLPLFTEPAEKLSPTFRQRLEAALRDGRLEDNEWTALSTLLKRERNLVPEQRARLESFLSASPLQ